MSTLGIEEQARHAAANGTGEGYQPPNVARAAAGLGEPPNPENPNTVSRTNASFDGPTFLKAQHDYIVAQSAFNIDKDQYKFLDAKDKYIDALHKVFADLEII